MREQKKGRKWLNVVEGVEIGSKRIKRGRKGVKNGRKVPFVHIAKHLCTFKWPFSRSLSKARKNRITSKDAQICQCFFGSLFGAFLVLFCAFLVPCAVLMPFQCPFGALLVPFWCPFGALLSVRLVPLCCIFDAFVGALLVHFWCISDAFLLHFWCIFGA